MTVNHRPHGRTARTSRTNPIYSVRLPHTLARRLDRYLRWQQRQTASSGASIHRCRAEAVRCLLLSAIDTIENAHEDRVTARDLAALFAQSTSRGRHKINR